MDPTQELEALLGEELPGGIQALSAQDQETLAALLVDARERQSQELQASLEDALSYVPALMRGTVKRILFP